MEYSTFDDVHDCQQTFRRVLHAIANPGEIVSIREQAERLSEERSVFLTLALTLLDKETRFMVFGDAAFARTVAELTYAPTVAEKADFIFVTDECSPEDIQHVFEKATPGTLVEPHTNSVLIIAVDKFDEAKAVCLTGPGIESSKQTGFTKYAKQWIVQRDMMEYEYPTGVDMYFVTARGELAAIPRRVRMGE